MAKKTAGKDPEHEALLKELKELIPQLNNEGLAWLADQAKIHLYNMRVDEHNAAIIAESSGTGRKSAGGKAAKTGAEKTGTTKPAGFSIRGAGSTFYLQYGNNDIMFTAVEMTRLVKIVNGPGTDLEIRERLYNWLDRERKDIFALANMKDKFDERLKNLAAVIKKSVKLRET